MVGRNTAHYDDPELTVRHWHGRNPTRIVLDPNLVLSNKLKLFDNVVPTWCFNCLRSEDETNLRYIKSPKNGFLEFIWHELYQSVKNYWDEARVFSTTKKFGKGIKAPFISSDHQEERSISGDLLKIYFNLNASH